jgi:hypothetical protein
MIRPYVSAFAIMLDRMGDFRKIDPRPETLQAAKDRLNGEMLGLPLYSLLHAQTSILDEWAKTIPLKSTIAQLRHIDSKFSGDHQRYKEAQLFDETEQLARRIREDLEGQLFYFANDKVADYYRAEMPFGPDVANNFSSANDDISEAGKCLALGRSTACVMHLMRVLEVGLVSLAHAVNADADRPGWEKIINNIRGKLNDMNASTHGADWKRLKDLYSDAAAHLLVSKDAWRNHAMHKPVHYGEQKAKDIYASVRAFMASVASELGEP